MQKKIFKRIPPEAKLVALGNQFRRDEPSSFWRFSTFFSRLDRQEYSENFELEALCVMGLGRKFMQNTEQLYTSSGFHQTLTFPPVEQWEDALLGDCPRLAKRLAAKSEVANQRCFVFTAGGVKVWLPKLELARKLFFHAGFMVRAAYLPNGLDNLFQMRLGADKLSYDVFTPSRTGVPIAFLKQPAYREFFSWLLVNKDIRNSFESIWQALNAEQTIKNGYCRWVFNFNPPTSIAGVEAMFRGIYNHEEKEMLVWEIASLSGLPYNTLRTVIFNHPQLKQPVKNGDAVGGGAGGDSPGAIEIDTEDEPSGDNERVRIELPSESLSFDREIKTKVNYKGQKGYPGGKGGGDSLSDAGTVQVVSTKDDVIDGCGRAGDFDLLSGDYDKYKDRFITLVEVINELSSRYDLKLRKLNIQPLPIVKRCSYHLMRDGRPRCYLIAKFQVSGGSEVCLLEIDTSDGAALLSTLIIKIHSDEVNLVSQIIQKTLKKSLRWSGFKNVQYTTVMHPKSSFPFDKKQKIYWSSRLNEKIKRLAIELHRDV